MYDRVYPTVASGDDACRLCIMHAYRSYNAFLSENAAYDFYLLDSLDLDQSYWNRRVIDALTVVQEAYYDTVLQYRVSNAPDDREMVRLIYDTVVYDPGIAFCDGNNGLFNLVYLACFGITQNTPRITSFVKSNSKSALKGLDELFKTK